MAGDRITQTITSLRRDVNDILSLYLQDPHEDPVLAQAVVNMFKDMASQLSQTTPTAKLTRPPKPT